MSVQLTTEMIQAAQQTEQEYGVPASVTLGQLILESSGSYKNGMSKLAAEYNNFFGVTAGSSWTGETVQMSNSQGQDTQTYRVYSSILDSITDHAKVLCNERYTQYTKTAKTVSEYVDGVAKGGYATDPAYASKVKQVISSNNLTAYDGNSWQGKSGTIQVSNTSTDVTQTSTSEKDMKWWGDLIIMILTVLMIFIGIVFFLLAFDGSFKLPSMANPLKKLGGGKS